MTEAEIAQMVAEAVAAHDERTTWLQELAANGETIAALLIAGVAAIAGIVRWGWGLRAGMLAGFAKQGERIAWLEGRAGVRQEEVTE